MVIDDTGIAELATLEGLSLKAMWDVTGWSLGYGKHDPSFTQDSVCTKEQAYSWLHQDSINLSALISPLIKVDLRQGQFNALVILSYNIGFSAFKGSHLLERLNSGNFDSIPNEFRKWIYSNHKINQGLVARREKEIEIWNT